VKPFGLHGVTYYDVTVVAAANVVYEVLGLMAKARQ
jgi:hypothetical protein